MLSLSSSCSRICPCAAAARALRSWRRSAWALAQPGQPARPRLAARPQLNCAPPGCAAAGLDWDELEEQARAEDREHNFSEEEEEEFGRKRKSKGGGGGGGGKKARR